jgi:hypothetical protein
MGSPHPKVWGHQVSFQYAAFTSDMSLYSHLAGLAKRNKIL